MCVCVSVFRAISYVYYAKICFKSINFMPNKELNYTHIKLVGKQGRVILAS